MLDGAMRVMMESGKVLGCVTASQASWFVSRSNMKCRSNFTYLGMFVKDTLKEFGSVHTELGPVLVGEPLVRRARHPRRRPGGVRQCRKSPSASAQPCGRLAPSPARHAPRNTALHIAVHTLFVVGAAPLPASRLSACKKIHEHRSLCS